MIIKKNSFKIIKDNLFKSIKNIVFYLFCFQVLVLFAFFFGINSAQLKNSYPWKNFW